MTEHPGPAAAPTILVVDDEPLIRDSIADRLRAEGFAVTTADDGPAALAAQQGTVFDAVVLDVMLPGMDGLEVCRRMQTHTTTPVLMLTARADETDLVIGLGIGADDYLSKPFSMRELVARLRALIRRAERYAPDATAGPPAPETEVETLGEVQIDHAARRVLVSGSPIHLTRTEFDLLVSLARRPGAVLTRAQLLESVWQWPDAGETRTVDSHIRSLRQKVGAHHIRTVHGVGYALEVVR
ncbi:response regulator transcription factor [Williamsia sterculiae]|uniref:DNA-binding response regulator, OmpR family, contains REC and winged-helix (WHTH) domain n=1 Tax=Williamsia sterculiae TaxID=1344003 RepID=A0A1N7GR23_9NOCA|nr:response regulator transcription factor [Williamsia sterculiae]SIS15033.1 DNA-binding response regulator, OmpR family, contains REC and winged-helix (wHTH) domain [Williamsia sterculiae]